MQKVKINPQDYALYIAKENDEIKDWVFTNKENVIVDKKDGKLFYIPRFGKAGSRYNEMLELKDIHPESRFANDHLWLFTGDQ